ncbi:histidinol-phosphate transaminase [Aestuariibius insulae]|uniref:histidinol-phosphate transaminase n=1 Tax=Aestuariibius insulae TaxID=2058287 RepID=UPI00345E440B
MTQILRPQPGILDIELYKGGASHIAGQSNALKLSSNENPFGPSPAAVEAFRRASHDLHRYPSSDHAALREAIAETHGLDPARLICAAGSGDVINLMCQAYAGPGDEVIHTEHGFALYRIYALAAGATPVSVPEHERMTDIEAILAAVTGKTRLVFIANPNNPTGTMVGTDALASLADRLPEQCMLVLDGAYAEYVDGYDAGLALIEARQNVMMIRTFSKLYGLGGLRIGWSYGPQEVIDVLNRIRGPFNLSSAALAAAEAAVRDRDYAGKCLASNTQWRHWLAEALAALGVPSDTSMANFILARFTDEAEAEACNAFLKSEGIIVRQMGGYNLPHCLRITVGDEAACRRVAHAVGLFKGQAK